MVRSSDRVESPDRVGVSGDAEHAGTRFLVEAPGRRVQVSQLLVAVLLVGVSALAALVLFTQVSAREPVLALANPMERGRVVTAEDLRVVHVGSDEQVTTISAEVLGSLLGLTAVADLEAGTIVTPAHFAADAVLESGEGVVGLALSAGEYPTLRLAPGDLVDVIDPGGGLLVSGAVVFEVAELGAQGQRFVSLRMSAADAAEVARAAGAGGVRLVLVGGER